MDFAVTGAQQEVQGRARELAGQFAERAAGHDRDRTAPVENYAQLRDAGFYGMVIPSEYGGMGHGPLTWFAAAEELAKGCASTALSFNMHINATGAIMDAPDISTEKKRFVADLAIKQGKLMCTSVSEPTSSSLLAASYIPQVKARRVEGGYRLYGKKAFASMWEASDLAFLYAHVEDDPSPTSGIGLLAPTSGEGVHVEDVWNTLGMRATRSQTVLLDGAFVPEEYVLHRVDPFINSFLIAGAAWSFGGYTAVYLGLGTAIADFAKELLAGRVAKGFTQPMGYHPDIRRHVAKAVCALEAARLVLRQAGWTHETVGPSPASFLQFLKAKYLVGEAVAEAARHATVACGVHSLFTREPLERMVRDATTAAIMPPSADACLGLIGLLEMGLDPREEQPPLKMAPPPAAT